MGIPPVTGNLWSALATSLLASLSVDCRALRCLKYSATVRWAEGQEAAALAPLNDALPDATLPTPAPAPRMVRGGAPGSATSETEEEEEEERDDEPNSDDEEGGPGGLLPHVMRRTGRLHPALRGLQPQLATPRSSRRRAWLARPWA